MKMSSYSYYQYQTQAQQQQQPTSAATTGAVTWNGSQWVPTAAASASASASTSPAAAAATAATAAPAQGEAPPPAPQAPPGHSDPPPNSTPQVYVTAYSTFYQEWKSQSQQQSQLAATLPAGSERDEATRRAQWAEYYADQSSRCAHYYNTLLSRGGVDGGVDGGGGGGQGQQQQYLPVPPPPPQQQQYGAGQEQLYGQYGAPQQQQRQQQQQQQRQQRWGQAPAVSAAPSPAAPASAPPPPPESMKRYVHRCLARCTTEEQKKRVQAEVEVVISEKIRQGTLQQTDWDRLDCVPVEEEVAPSLPSTSNNRGFEQQQQQQQQQQRYQHHSTHSSSSPYKKPRSSGGSGGGGESYGHYGPPPGGGGGGASVSSHGDNSRGGGGGGGGSYYGPASGGGGGSSFGEDQSDFISFNVNKNKSPTPSKRKRSHQQGKKKKKHQQHHQANDDDYYAPQPSPIDGFERSNEALSARQARFAGRGGIDDAAHSTSRSGVANVERYMGKTVIGGSRKLDEADFEAMTVKGTCTVLEKEYLRLTAPPRAELVRPEPVLREHLTNLKKLWLQPEEKRGPKRDYVWFCSQFKSMRQDLTVQRIFNSFSVDTYETHARIALEQGDINEFNQCQTQLKELYEKLSHDKSAEEVTKGLKNETEFIAYRILYYIFLAGNKKYEGGSSDMMKIMLSLSAEQRKHPVISHALKVRVAVADFDYHAFFKLQDACPNMGAYLMDYLVPSVRQAALQRIHKAFRPSIAVNYVLSELGFELDSSDAEEGKAWLISCGCKLSEDGKTFLTKDSVLKESDLVAKKSSLI